MRNGRTTRSAQPGERKPPPGHSTVVSCEDEKDMSGVARRRSSSRKAKSPPAEIISGTSSSNRDELTSNYAAAQPQEISTNGYGSIAEIPGESSNRRSRRRLARSKSPSNAEIDSCQEDRKTVSFLNILSIHY